jgi:hypothetical protein
VELLMRYVIVILALLLSACSTVVPVAVKFPEPPGKGAMTACPTLQKLQNDARLSDVANTVTVNYSTYYECAVRADAWQEWYRIQQIIFEKAAK